MEILNFIVSHFAELINFWGVVFIILGTIYYSVWAWRLVYLNIRILIVFIAVFIILLGVMRLQFYVGRVFFDYDRNTHGQYLVALPSIPFFFLIGFMLASAGEIAKRYYYQIMQQHIEDKREIEKLKGIIITYENLHRSIGD